MSIYQRGKSWYYDFQSRGERYAGCIGQVSKSVAKEVLARKRAEAAEGRYRAPAKQPESVSERLRRRLSGVLPGESTTTFRSTP